MQLIKKAHGEKKKKLIPMRMNLPKIIKLKKKLEKLVNGKIEFSFRERGKFTSKTEDYEYHMSNTASGIKQIGILQNLLNKDILKEDGFVFIDEPEVNYILNGKLILLNHYLLPKNREYF